MTSTTRPARSRSIRLLTIGVAASGLCLAGAGLAVTNAGDLLRDGQPLPIGPAEG
ncbi:MAG: hypothetical protein ABW025_07630 [Cellulomonas sp.]